jgi:REP element-mobilizing transposase RayT
MTRLRRIATSDRIFFVTTNIARNRAALSLVERDVLLDVIAERLAQGAFWLFSYCVMPDHLRLLIRPHNRDLAAAMPEIKSVSGARIVHGRRTSGSIWQPKYIHTNPVAAGLVAHAGEWRWSSYLAIVEGKPAPIEVDPIDLPADPNALLWPSPWK